MRDSESRKEDLNLVSCSVKVEAHYDFEAGLELTVIQLSFWVLWLQTHANIPRQISFFCIGVAGNVHVTAVTTEARGRLWWMSCLLWVLGTELLSPGRAVSPWPLWSPWPLSHLSRLWTFYNNVTLIITNPLIYTHQIHSLERAKTGWSPNHLWLGSTSQHSCIRD